jgi:hypothetical protein
LKLELIADGPKLTPLTAAEGFSSVMLLDGEEADSGSAKGGFELSPVTMLVVGS